MCINSIFEFQVSSIEKFALLLSNHFLTKYDHVVATKINIEEAPWKRMEVVSMITDVIFKHIPACRDRDLKKHSYTPRKLCL